MSRKKKIIIILILLFSVISLILISIFTFIFTKRNNSNESIVPEEQLHEDDSNENITNDPKKVDDKAMGEQGEYYGKCFPDDFEPERDIAESINTVTGEKIYEAKWAGIYSLNKEINYLRNGVELRIYAVMCGYIESPAVYEFRKDNKRLEMFIGVDDPHPDETPVNDELGLYFFRTQSGEKFIYNAVENIKFELDEKGENCTNFKAYWFDSNLFTSESVSEYPGGGLPEGEQSNICIWSSTGKLLHKNQINLYYGAVAPGYLLLADIDLVQSKYLYVYTNSGQNNLDCKFTMYNLETKEKKDYVVGKKSETIEDIMTKCPKIKPDFSKMNSDMTGITWSEIK